MTAHLTTNQPHALQREDLLWSGLSFTGLSEEELAQCQASVEDKVHFHRGVWWRQARPFFCVPCSIYRQIDSRQSWPNPVRAVGGFMHLSAPDSVSNGTYPAITCENVSNYSISILSQSSRNKVRRGLEQLTVRIVERLEDLLSDGYEVYVSCHERISWGRNKTGRSVFEAWIRRVYGQRKQIILGAYRGNTLVGFTIQELVGKTVEFSYMASRSDMLKYHPNDVLYHSLLCIARQTTGVMNVSYGPVCNKPSLNAFKLKYGAVRYFPSYIWFNPLIPPLFIKYIRSRYPWLGAISSSQR